MRFIKQTFLICAIALGLSAVAFGQKDKTPPKPPPPVIKPGEKPKNDDKPKKPNSDVAVWKQQETNPA